MSRTTDWDARVKTLAAQLREALVERERARLEARVDSMMSGLMKDGTPSPVLRRNSPKAAGPATPKSKKRGVYKRTAAQRKASAERMRAYWAAKKKAAAK